MANDDVQNVSLNALMEDILSLVPPSQMTPKQLVTIVRVTKNMGILAGTITALQQTAGRVFEAHRNGNTQAADAFFEILTTIETPQL